MKMQDAIGETNGLNDLFETTIPYIQGSLEVFLNGVLARRQDQDGWDEVPPKSFRMREVPQSQDRIRVVYKV